MIDAQSHFGSTDSLARLLGRTISTMRFLTVTAAPLGALTGGWLGEHLTIRPALVIIAVAGIALSLAVLCPSPLRTIRGH